MKRLMNNVKVYKYYKYVSIFFIGVGAIVFALDYVGDVHNYFKGIATSFIILGIVLGTMVFIKRQDQDFKDNLDLIKEDERVKKNHIKNHAILNVIAIFLIVVLITYSVFYELSFAVGGTIILFAEIIVGLYLYLFKNRVY